MQIMISLVLWLLMGSLNSYFAYKRGRDPVAWFMIGMLLGILGLAFLFLLPRLEPAQPSETDLPFDDDPELSHDYTKNEWYFVDAARQQQGPFHFRILKHEWADGRLNGDSFVWSEGMPNWIRISDLPGFKEVLTN